MKQHHIYLSLLLFIVPGFISCSQDDVIDKGSGTVEGENIVLKLSVSKTSQSRATEDGDDTFNENLIKTLDVFIYADGQDDCTFYQRITPATELNGTGESDVVLNITQQDFIYNINYNVYVLANYTGTVASAGIPLSALKALSISGLNPDAVQETFLMDGVSSPTILNDYVIKNKYIPISMRRAAVKIRIGMVYGNNFTLSATNPISKQLMHYATNSSVLSSGDPVDAGLQSMSSFTSISSGVNKNGEIILYSYANDWNKIKSQQTYVLVNIPVVDGSGVEHPQNYYKIPVNYLLPSDSDSPSQSDDSDLYKLQRNYLYDVTVLVDALGDPTPLTTVTLNANYTIQDWTTREVIVEVEGLNYLYVQNLSIVLPNATTYTTTFQSSSAIQISNITVNDTPITNGSSGVNITWDQNISSGNIIINSALPTNFFSKVITFTVSNESNLTQKVTVTQYPPLYLSSDESAETPSGGQGQNNTKMYIISSLVADFAALQNPDEFNEPFPSGYTHYAPDPVLGASYADYIRSKAVLGVPLKDSNGATIDTEENNRRISPAFMLASQYGATTPASYTESKNKCISYSERDETTGLTYTDWRMPTLAELYMIDILQNTSASEVKAILEGSYYWSAQQSSSVKFMDPRVGNTSNFNYLHTSVRCVRDVEN